MVRINWIDCNKHRLVKEAKTDFGKINSIKEIAESKINTANVLTDEHYYGKITLLYDALRELLEYLALYNGYKIYNHECYTAFLKEILNESYIGDEFDKFRVLRNGINYYGRKINQEEGVEIAKQMVVFINKINILINQNNKK